MTICIEQYSTNSGKTIACIRQEKYCNSFQLVIIERTKEDGKPITIFHGTYMTKKSARQALKRFSMNWTKEEGQ